MMNKYKMTINGVSGKTTSYVLSLTEDQIRFFMDRFADGNTKLTISFSESSTFLAFNFDNVESVIVEKCN